MKNKIDIGEFVKKAFEKDAQLQVPDEKVMEKIHKTLDKPKIELSNTLLWMTFSVVIIGIAFYLFLDTGSDNLQDENSIDNTPPPEQSNELSAGEFIGPALLSDLDEYTFIQDNTSIQDNTLDFYSLIIDTTQQNLINTTPIKAQTSAVSTNHNIDDLFKQKTIYHYYRASDSVKIKTTDKRVIDSILTTKNNQQPIDSLQ